MPAGQPAPSAESLSAIIGAHLHLEGPLLPIFHALQAEFGHVPQAALPLIAEALNLSGAEVHGVMSFYHDFRDHPAGRHVLRICRAEACQAMGGDAVSEAALKRLGLDWHGTTANGAVTIEPVFCLGLCACGPAAQLDGKLHGRVTPARVAELIAGVGA